MIWGGAASVLLVVAGLLLIAGVARTSIERFSSDAVQRFPGGRVHALIETVECEECSLPDRNHSVWALGQMEAAPALPALMKRYTGERCDHNRRLCQKELRKAIQMIEERSRRTNFLWRAIRALHQPRA